MKRFLLICLFLTLALPSHAEDLTAVYRLAQQHDAAFAAARAGYQAGREKAPQGQAQLLPSLTFNAATYKSRQDVTIVAPNHYDYRTDSYGLVLTQPLYRKQNFADSAKGEAGAAQAEHDFTGARHDLIVRVARTYLGVLAANDSLAYAQAEKNSIDRLAQLARRNFSVGNGSLVDVHDTQAAFDLANAQELVAQNELEVRREALRVLTRQEPGNLASLGSRLPLETPDPADIAHWVEAARRQSPQIKSAEQGLEIATQELEKSRGGHYPTLDLTASHVYSDAGGSAQGFAIESTTNQLGLVFQLPLYAGGASSSRVRESYARREEAAQRLDQIRRATDQQARESYLAVLSSKARVEALDQALASNQRALETTLIGYERGLRNGQDVLNSQRTLFRARRDFSQARYDYLLSRLRLKASAGTLGEDDLQAVNAVLIQR